MVTSFSCPLIADNNPGIGKLVEAYIFKQLAEKFGRQTGNSKDFEGFRAYDDSKCMMFGVLVCLWCTYLALSVTRFTFDVQMGVATMCLEK